MFIYIHFICSSVCAIVAHCRTASQKCGVSTPTSWSFIMFRSIVVNAFTAFILASIELANATRRVMPSLQFHLSALAKRNSYHLFDRTELSTLCKAYLLPFLHRRFALASTLRDYHRAWKVHCVFHDGTFERFNFVSSNVIVMQQQQRYTAHSSVYGHCFGAT